MFACFVTNDENLNKKATELASDISRNLKNATGYHQQEEDNGATVDTYHFNVTYNSNIYETVITFINNEYTQHSGESKWMNEYQPHFKTDVEKEKENIKPPPEIPVPVQRYFNNVLHFAIEQMSAA
jgi:hypothetical protein